MKYKDYSKLMKTPFDELSEEDQNKRKKEFHRRLEVAQMFVTGMIKGHVNDDIGKFAVPRLGMGVRWWEDILLNGNG